MRQVDALQLSNPTYLTCSIAVLSLATFLRPNLSDLLLGESSRPQLRNVSNPGSPHFPCRSGRLHKASAQEIELGTAVHVAFEEL
jgi:hypothetical protein